MEKYLAIARATWYELFAYRLNLFLEVFGNILLLAATLGLWSFLFHNTSGTIGGYTREEMVTYLLAAGIVLSFLWATNQGDEINDDINQGKISSWLLKPIAPIGVWFSRDLVRKCMTFSLGIGAFALLFLFFRNALSFAPWPTLLLAVFAALCAALLHFLLFSAFSVIAFWFQETWGERFVLRIVMEIAAGTLIPISLFPDVLRKVFVWLPFQYMIYFPANLVVGKFSVAETVQGFLGLGAWIVVSALLLTVFWKRGVVRYVAEGG